MKKENLVLINNEKINKSDSGYFCDNIDFELSPHVIFGTNIDFEP